MAVVSNDLNVLFPAADTMIAGESLSLRPFSFGKLPKVIGYLSDVLHIIINIPDELIAEIQTNPEWYKNLDTIEFFSNILVLGGDNILNLLALAVDKPREWVDKLDPDQGLFLLFEVFEINLDFFTRRFTPVWKQILSQKATAIQEKMAESDKKVQAGA